MPSSDKKERALTPTRRSNPRLLADAVAAVDCLTDVPAKGGGQWSREVALGLVGDLFDLGDQKALNLTMKFIEHLKMDKTNKREAKRELVRLSEVASFYQSIGMTIKDLAPGLHHPECDIGGFHIDMIRIRDNISPSLPLNLFKMSSQDKEDQSMYLVSFFGRFAISLQPQFMLGSALVPYPEDCDQTINAQLASHFLFRVSFKSGDESRSGSNGNGMSVHGGGDRVDGQAVVREEQDEHVEKDRNVKKKEQNQPTTTLTGLPRVVLELGHVVILDVRENNRTRTGAHQTPTGMGLFADMEDRDKTLWLIRTTPYMACPRPRIQLQGGVRGHMGQLNLDGSHGAIPLGKSIIGWMSMNIHKQAGVLKSGTAYSKVESMFERFMVDRDQI
ncbi:hypothetical protein GGTG_11002 [Gaeumannomyces tritici R3-111a-1]|uniref:Uncharacterized protein n=1 Tax=Gaeumannomyces tritici (strain R3-111a-1) TaxID=644352 RepID=J3PBX8_GAET3|nr:hypothetical protein GGTG_11002 [Gaeumannomyces tritici R3-111a-1]EJT71748.1 hypothetical protein GGTG_11002 [Gaeumannomyces tritici R3-111a-1]